MTPRHRHPRREEPSLPFDATQDIEPAFAEDLRRDPEPTLTDSDFDRLATERPPQQR